MSCEPWRSILQKVGKRICFPLTLLALLGRSGGPTGEREQHCRVYFVTRKNAQTSSTFILQQIGLGGGNAALQKWPIRLELLTLSISTRVNLMLGLELQILAAASLYGRTWKKHTHNRLFLLAVGKKFLNHLLDL